MKLHTRLARTSAVLVVIAIANISILASGATGSAANEATNAKVVLGKLVTVSNRPILVNGGEAITGTTIVSGSQLITPASGGAVINLNSIGTVSVAPSSNVVLSFDAKNVIVRVASGDASVATASGVNGTVVGGDSAPAKSAPVPAGGSSAKNWGIAGVAIGSAGFIWALIAWNKANNADDAAKAAQAANATLAAQLAALRTCLAGQTQSPVKLCTSF